jgi:hypothetical protein
MIKKTISTISYFLSASKDTDPQKVKILVIGCVLFYITIMMGLWISWYGNQDRVDFHWFDDSQEWLYMDKLGHVYTAYIIAMTLYRLWKWTGISKEKNIFYTVSMTWVWQASYEYFDGLYIAYGASLYDLAANTLGLLLFVLQIVYFNSILLWLKWSVHLSPWAIIRPDLLGNNIFIQLIKDYNGHTYWYSLDVNKWLGLKYWPSWLMICIGIGADGLLGGVDNVWSDVQNNIQDYSHVMRTNRWYVSIDINPFLIDIKWIRYILAPFNYMKIPCPCLELSVESGISWHWVKF